MPFDPILAGHISSIPAGLSLFVRTRSAPYDAEHRGAYDPATVYETAVYVSNLHGFKLRSTETPMPS